MSKPIHLIHFCKLIHLFWPDIIYCNIINLGHILWTYMPKLASRLPPWGPQVILHEYLEGLMQSCKEASLTCPVPQRLLTFRNHTLSSYILLPIYKIMQIFRWLFYSVLQSILDAHYTYTLPLCSALFQSLPIQREASYLQNNIMIPCFLPICEP